MPIGAQPEEPATLSDEDKADLAPMGRFQTEESAYAMLQGIASETRTRSC